eukprot:6488430-Amphidinium_carterae.2
MASCNDVDRSLLRPSRPLLGLPPAVFAFPPWPPYLRPLGASGVCTWLGPRTVPIQLCISELLMHPQTRTGAAVSATGRRPPVALAIRQMSVAQGGERGAHLKGLNYA